MYQIRLSALNNFLKLWLCHFCDSGDGGSL